MCPLDSCQEGTFFCFLKPKKLPKSFVVCDKVRTFAPAFEESGASRESSLKDFHKQTSSTRSECLSFFRIGIWV